MQDTGYLWKIEVAFAKRPENPCERMKFLLIIKMKRISFNTSSSSNSSRDKEGADLEVLCVCLIGSQLSVVRVSASLNCLHILGDVSNLRTMLSVLGSLYIHLVNARVTSFCVILYFPQHVRGG